MISAGFGIVTVVILDLQYNHRLMILARLIRLYNSRIPKEEAPEQIVLSP
jgi:hypothetical protein